MIPDLKNMEEKLLVLCMVFLIVQCSSGITDGKTCFVSKTILACQDFKNMHHLKTGKFPIDQPAAYLVQLHINNFGLNQIDPDAFHRMIDLKLLDLSHNKLEVLIRGWFYTLTKLITLRLSHNLLRSFSDQKLFSNNNLLLQMDLSNNNLSHFNINVVANLTKLNLIKLENNSFVCDCELKNIKIWATERNVTMNSSCELPPSYTVVPWSHLDVMNSYLCPSIALIQQQDTSVFHQPINIPMWALVTSVMTIIVVVIISIIFVYLFVNHIRNKRTVPSTSSFSVIYDDIMPDDFEFIKSAEVCQEAMTTHLRTEKRYSKTPTSREEITNIPQNEQPKYLSFQNDLCNPSVGTEPVTSENMYSEDGYLNPRNVRVSSVGKDVKYESIGDDINSNETHSMEDKLRTQSAYEYDYVSSENSFQEHVQSSNFTKIEDSTKPGEFHERHETFHNASAKNQHMKQVIDCVENASVKTEINENDENGNGCYHYIQNEHEYSEDGYLKPRNVNSYSEIEVQNSYEYITRTSKADASSTKTLDYHEQRTSNTTSDYECIENYDDVNKCNSKLNYEKKAADPCESARKNKKRSMLASALNLFQPRHKNYTSTSAIPNNSVIYDDVGNREDPCYMEIQEKH